MTREQQLKEAYEELVVYELGSSWWAGYCFTDWMRSKCAEYYVNKVKRKMQNYGKFSKALNRL